jgi:anti-anti-sigma factor
MSFVVKAFQPSDILDGINGSQLRREIISALEIGVDIVLIDLQDVKVMYSAGLCTLLAALRAAKETDSKVFICSLNEPIKMIFEMSKTEANLLINTICLNTSFIRNSNIFR